MVVNKSPMGKLCHNVETVTLSRFHLLVGAPLWLTGKMQRAAQQSGDLREDSGGFRA